MFGLAKHNLRALGLLGLALLCSLSHAEPGYPGRDNGFASNDPMYDYSAEIQKNKKAMAQKPGEGDAAYRERTSHLYTEITAPPVAHDDVATGQGTVDRAEKLKDAQRFAQEGFNAATAQAADMAIAQFGAISNIAGTFDPAVLAQATADSKTYGDAAQKYAKIQQDMNVAKVNNGNGFTRLRYDPEDGDGAGKAPPPDPSLVSAVMDRLSDDQRKKLEDRGVDPEDFVERLLSGEIDTSDPNSVLRALNDTRQLSSAELAEVQALAEAKLAEGGGAAEAAAGAGIEIGGSELKETRELASATDKSGKTDEKDPSKVTTPGLAGIAIRLINREVMGYRLSDLLGGKGRRDAKVATVPVNGKGVADSAAARKAGVKKLTATDYYQLQGQGITAPRHGNNIFKMAHRQFRDYSKWRDQPQPTKGRVALAR